MVGYRYLEFLSPFVREKYLSQLPGGVPMLSESSATTDENASDDVESQDE